MTAPTAATRTWGTGHAAEVLGIARTTLASNLHNPSVWRPMFPNLQRGGSGSRVRLDERDMVVLAMLVDATNVFVGGLRHELAAQVRAAEWGQPLVHATSNGFHIAYRPRWSIADQHLTAVPPAVDRSAS